MDENLEPPASQPSPPESTKAVSQITISNNNHIDSKGAQLLNPPQITPHSNKKVVKKVVKIIHMSAPKNSEPSHQNTTQPPAHLPIDTRSNNSVKVTADSKNLVDPVANTQMSSMQFTVNSPRLAGEDVKPKRTLIVKSTGTSPAISPRTPAEDPSGFMFPASAKASATQANDSIMAPSVTVTEIPVRTFESPSNSLAAARQRFFASMTVPVETTSTETVLEKSKVTEYEREYLSAALPLSPTDDSTYASLLLTSPRSISSIHLSPRSDISSNTNSPRQLDVSKLKISSILELDIPETSIDGDNHCHEQVTPNSHQHEGVSDKISCTTDESGFTSGSSDSDVTLAPPGECFIICGSFFN